MEVNKKQKLSPLQFKILIVNVVNLLLLVGIFVLLPQNDKIAHEVKKVATEAQGTKQIADIAVTKADIEKDSEKINSIKDALSGEKTLVSFVGFLDRLASEGVISGYELLSTAEVSEKNGFKGVPILISFLGSIQNYSDGIQRITNEKFFVKPVTLNYEKKEDGSKALKYGIFLYTQ